jgi:hypothetical protein
MTECGINPCYTIWQWSNRASSDDVFSLTVSRIGSLIGNKVN